MSAFFLDLRDRLPVMDFIAAQLAYLSETERKKDEVLFRKIENGEERPSQGELADMARRVGRKSWAPRQALAAYVQTQSGCDEEWRKVVASVSAGTAHLLERFRHGTKCESLDTTLNHEESGSAFRDLERLEIEQVRATIREVIWRAKRKSLAPQVKAAEGTLKNIQLRLDQLRELASGTPAIEDEIFSKLNRLENDLYFAGNELDVKELDAEIAYYREEKAIPTEG